MSDSYGKRGFTVSPTSKRLAVFILAFVLQSCTGILANVNTKSSDDQPSEGIVYPIVATPQIVEAIEEVPSAIALTGIASDTSLVYTVVTQPAHGTLSSLNGNSTSFVSEPGYNGLDSFSFKVSNGAEESLPATVTIHIAKFCSGEALTNAPFAAGSGTVASPYLLCTAAQLNAISNNGAYMAKNFKLMTDIDLAGLTVNQIGGTYTGLFDGNNRVLSHYTGGKGLFKIVSGTVKRLIMSDAALSISDGRDHGVMADSTLDAAIILNSTSSGTIIDSGPSCNIGGLVGSHSGTISGSSSSVDISIFIGSGCAAGGLVGISDGYNDSFYNGGSISNSFATGSLVSAGSDPLGGLVGMIDENASITECYANGNITTTGDGPVGGLVATTTDQGFLIQDSYHSGGVVTSTGTGYVGDLIGVVYKRGGGGGTAILANTYSTGSHGLIGYLDSTYGSDYLEYDNFYDVTLAPFYASFGTEFPLSTNNFTTTTSLGFWSAAVWNIGAGHYPTLKRTGGMQ